MSKFTFDKKEPKLLKLEIEGKTFRFNPYAVNVKMAMDYFTEHQAKLENVRKKTTNQKEISKLVLRACKLVQNTTDKILGKGSYERIFTGRTISFTEHEQLMTFIFEEITAFYKANPLKNNEPFA